jgi:hypothetical protein
MRKVLSIIFIIGSMCVLTFQTYSQSVTIDKIRAYLFYSKEKYGRVSENVAGTFSTNIIDNPKIVLFNTDIGEGSADGYSNQLLVKVVARNKNTEGISANKTVRLKAESDGKEVYLSETDITIGINEYYYVAFLFSFIDCTPTILTAELLDGKTKAVESSMKKTINFTCGE